MLIRGDQFTQCGSMTLKCFVAKLVYKKRKNMKRTLNICTVSGPVQ